jgi:hypothetical protein
MRTTTSSRGTPASDAPEAAAQEQLQPIEVGESSDKLAAECEQAELLLSAGTADKEASSTAVRTATSSPGTPASDAPEEAGQEQLQPEGVEENRDKLAAELEQAQLLVRQSLLEFAAAEEAGMLTPSTLFTSSPQRQERPDGCHGSKDKPAGISNELDHLPSDGLAEVAEPLLADEREDAQNLLPLQQRLQSSPACELAVAFPATEAPAPVEQQAALTECDTPAPALDAGDLGGVEQDEAPQPAGQQHSTCMEEVEQAEALFVLHSLLALAAHELAQAQASDSAASWERSCQAWQ